MARPAERRRLGTRRKRTLKVCEQFRTTRGGDRVVPQIRLCGKWLADAGFQIGDSVLVVVGDHELYIAAPRSA